MAIVSERVGRMFGEDTLVGRTILINGQSVLVTGVVAAGFRGTKRLAPIDVWMPLAQLWAALPPGTNPPARIGPGGQRMGGLIGRRDPSVPLAVLQQQIAQVEQAMVTALPPDSRRFERTHFRAIETLERNPRDRDSLVLLFRILVVAAALLLLLACANAGNALLVRAMERAGELATRLALGASRWRLARALFVEGWVLSLVAGVIGVGIAALVARLMDGTAILTTAPAMERPVLDRFVVGGSAVVCLIVAVGASVSAMWSVRRANVAQALRQSSRSVASGRRRVTQGLTVVQVAVSVMLLIGATLFVRSIDAMLGIDVGLDRSRVQTFRLEPRRLPGGASLVFRHDVIERLGAIPGVTRATVAFLPPFYSGNEARISLRADDVAESTAATTLMLNAVHPGFFDAVGLSLVAGRDFTDDELRLPGAQTPLILPESIARRIFGTTDVVGRSVLTQAKERREIVGVVRDSRQRQLLADDTMDLAFQPHRADYWTPFITGVMRVDSPDLNVWPDVRRILADLDPTLVMFETKSVEEGIRTEIGTRILTMRVALAIGGVAVFLAAVGLVTVLARGLAERRRELGIRTALGATPARLAALIGRQSMVVLVLGVTIGTLAAMWLTRYIESRLYGISRLDPVSFITAIGIIVAVMLAVSLPICRRAAKTDPAATLRETS